MYDLIVIGGGNAALCAALKAREQGLTVLLLESAPFDWRGGNSCHTRNLRCMHDAPQDVLTESYPEEEYWEDLLKVTGGLTNEHLARIVIRMSSECRPWMKKHGVRFQGSLSGTLHLSRTNAFFLGGGKALVNAYYRSAEQLGIEIRYEAKVDSLDIRDGTFHGVNVNGEYIEGRSCVVASGGFESNKEWLKEAWGEIADNFLIRGTRFNQGVVLKDLLAKGADQIGDPKQCHAVAIDARAPDYDGGICTRIDCVSLGIVVNKNAQRFYDEGEDFWPKRYAIWGRLVAGQPDQIGYSIIDQKAVGRFMPPVFPGVVANTIEDLARGLHLDPGALRATIDAYNAACVPGNFDHAVLDNCHTQGLEPNKTHWAQKIDQAPYYGYALKPGITFTYLGVKVDDRARILFKNQPSDNLFAAGEIMAGNVLGKGYLAGIGMSIGTTFGLIAGQSAVDFMRQKNSSLTTIS